MKSTRKRNRFGWQALALGLALASPFGLFWALIANLPVLAAILFAVLVFSMGLTIWAG
jgi:hypothetical protein